jgi:cell division septum initiation protein DivIVA
MPDQSSAAQEHALLEQITGPLASLPENPVAISADVDFPVALRGYDRIAVDAYVARTCQLIAELHATASPEGAIRRALERVGEEVSGVLQQAHRTADEVTTQSRAEAEDRLEAARREADQITAQAHDRLHSLDEDADRIWAERDRIVSDARDLARQLIELADAASARFPAADEPAGDTVLAIEPSDEPPATEALEPDAPEPDALGPEPFAAEAEQPEPADDVEDATAVLWRQAVPDD